MSEIKPTTLTRQEYRKAANQLFMGSYPGVDYKVKFKDAPKYLGTPTWEGTTYTLTNGGGGKLSIRDPTKRALAKQRQASNRNVDLNIPKEALDWLDQIDKLEPGSKEKYLNDLRQREAAYKSDLNIYRLQSGVSVDDGHMTTRSNNSPDARAPELSRVNQSKTNKLPLSNVEMRNAGLPTNYMDDIANFFAGTGTNAKAGIRERTRMLADGISGEQAAAIADRNQQLSAQKPNFKAPNNIAALRSRFASIIDPRDNVKEQIRQGALNILPEGPVRNTAQLLTAGNATNFLIEAGNMAYGDENSENFLDKIDTFTEDLIDKGLNEVKNFGKQIIRNGVQQYREQLSRRGA